MADIKWLEGNRIQIAPPKKTKKITGTRFATILGLNPWSTAFEIPSPSPAYQQYENAHLQLYRRSRTRLLG